MTSLLISTTNQTEVEMAMTCGADIIDLKDPALGALGALPIQRIKELISFVGGRKEISATIGDVPMEAGLIKGSVEAFTHLGLDYIKIGFFESSNYKSCLSVMQNFAESGIKLIAVLFVEYVYPEDLLKQIKDAGFTGLMFDTCEKNGKTIFDAFTVNQINALKLSADSLELMFGLAGSLNIQHISRIKLIAPTFAGFRGGVCDAENRVNVLNSEKINEIRKAL